MDSLTSKYDCKRVKASTANNFIRHCGIFDDKRGSEGFFYKSAAVVRQAQGSVWEVVDDIQRRYGWTDEQLFNVSPDRFVQIVKIVTKKTREEKLETKQNIAFNAWLQGVAGKITYRKYLEQLGLIAKKRETQQQKKENAKKNIDKAEAIVAKMRGGR